MRARVTTPVVFTYSLPEANDPLFEKRHDATQGMAATDMTKFERLGRTRHPMAQDK